MLDSMLGKQVQIATEAGSRLIIIIITRLNLAAHTLFYCPLELNMQVQYA